jgi:hypothetical protein
MPMNGSPAAMANKIRLSLAGSGQKARERHADQDEDAMSRGLMMCSAQPDLVDTPLCMGV